MGWPIHCRRAGLPGPVTLSFCLVICGVVAGSAFGQEPSLVEGDSPSAAIDSSLSKSATGNGVFLDSGRRRQAFGELARDAKVIHRLETVVGKVAKLVIPSVVHIQAEKNQAASSYDADAVEEAGSGVIVVLNKQSYILTNRHVVSDCDLKAIHITYWDGCHAHPTKILADPSTDVALLEIAEQNLVAARIGDSDELNTGDFVLAFGSPFGLSHSVTHGIVSAKSRRDLILGSEEVDIQDFIQTDAAINPGNSGGPLLNIEGEVVGVNTAIASNSGGNEGIGFSIPINLATAVADRLIHEGVLKRSYLGVRLDDTFTVHHAKSMGLPQANGAKVTNVTADSPAALAGIEPGDVILRFNGVEVRDSGHLVNLVGLSPPGNDMSMTYFRDGELLSTSVRVADRSTVHR